MSEFKPEPNEIVMVSNQSGHPHSVYYVQRFVLMHNGLYFCERDDGVKDKLVGWKYCIPNQQHPYYLNKQIVLE